MKFFKKTDIIIITVVIAVAGGIFLYNTLTASKDGAVGEIYLGNQLIRTVSLDDGKDMTFSVEERPAVVFHLHEDGSIEFEHSDCPDQVCVETGRIRVPGQSAACLPNQLILKIVPLGEDGYDENEVVI